MTLRSDAVAAYQQKESGRATAARQVLATTLSPAVVAGLTVAAIQAEEAFTLFVFTDGDLYLAVRSADGWDVALVLPVDGGWQSVGPVASLAGLGELAPRVPKGSPTTPPAVPDWSPQIAVKVGALYTYAKETWKVLQDHTTQVGWEPPNVPSLWVKVAK